MSAARSPRVLLSAYQCGPGMGSVSQIGWEWYQRLARRLRTTLVTHARNREALRQAGAPVDDPSQIVFIDTEWFAGPLYRFSKRLFPRSEHAVFLLSSADFFLYDWLAYRALRRRLRKGEGWDVVHVATPVTTAAPTHLHRLGMPVVRGPLNSGLGNPAGFDAVMRAESSWLYRVRDVSRLIDALIGSSRNAARILVATEATRASIAPRHHDRCTPMLENGIDLDRFRAAAWPKPPSKTEPLRVLFVGRLIPFKGVQFLLEAVSRLRQETPVRLRIVGDGPMLDAWKEEAVQRGVDDITDFTGARSLDDVAADMRWAHVFCLPSVRESGGAVLLEAMASSRPVIALAFGGPGEVVDEGVGRCMPLGSADEVAVGLCDALRAVVKAPAGWEQRGREGRRRAEMRYAWDAKIEEAVSLYAALNRTDGVRAKAGPTTLLKGDVHHVYDR